MVKRRKIGLIYHYNENWIGGTYYIQNLIIALNNIFGKSNFELVIFAENDNDFYDLKELTNYPLLTRGSYVKKIPVIKRLINRLGRPLLKKNIFSVFNEDIDLVFPAINPHNFKKNQCFLHWIPDFQEHYLPGFFSAKEIVERKTAQKRIIENGKYIVFSSNSAKNDFNKIYPNNNLEQFVLQFAVSHPALQNCTPLIEKYNLPEQYFICSNQFWKHKNHVTILKAINLLNAQGYIANVIFTGKEHDYRHPDFFKELMQIANKLGVEKNIRFLGFIKREEQLCLLKNAAAVIQPSLFEGWSTVLEDAKALNVKIIASDIDVHREQLNKNNSSIFFSANNENELAKAILEIDHIHRSKDDYKINVTEFAENFSKIFNMISSD